MWGQGEGMKQPCVMCPDNPSFSCFVVKLFPVLLFSLYSGELIIIMLSMAPVTSLQRRASCRRSIASSVANVQRHLLQHPLLLTADHSRNAWFSFCIHSTLDILGFSVIRSQTEGTNRAASFPLQFFCVAT
jgi:hypothetical protein